MYNGELVVGLDKKTFLILNLNFDIMLFNCETFILVVYRLRELFRVKFNIFELKFFEFLCKQILY